MGLRGAAPSLRGRRLARLIERRADDERLRVHRDDAGIEPPEVEELFQQVPQPFALLHNGAKQFVAYVGDRSLSRRASVVRTP